MCKQVRDLKLPTDSEGRVWTIGDLIDRTPKNLISKVMLEEKVFDSWHGGRTVLLGDGRSFFLSWDFGLIVDYPCIHNQVYLLQLNLLGVLFNQCLCNSMPQGKRAIVDLHFAARMATLDCKIS